MPQHVVEAFVAAEDQRFWVHPGIDYRGILRALFQLLATGSIESGGSTLTQQLARSYFLNLDQTVERKFKEASLAVRIEQEFSKEQIMALFLNKMFFGQRAYGVAAAAQVYFNKSLQDLSVAEAATLAGVLPAPSRYNPVRSAANAKMRRGYVLGRMLDLDFIDKAAWGLNAIFSNGDGFPRTAYLFCGGITDEKAYKRYLPTRQVATRVWYSAYPHLTTKNIANNAAIRAGLSATLSEAEAQVWLSRFGVGNKLPESGAIARCFDRIRWDQLCARCK